MEARFEKTTGDSRTVIGAYDKRTAKNGAVTYTFQVDVGTRQDGCRDRQRFPFRTLASSGDITD